MPMHLTPPTTMYCVFLLKILYLVLHIVGSGVKCIGMLSSLLIRPIPDEQQVILRPLLVLEQQAR